MENKSPAISQKEYLKKYLSKGKDAKNKKKRPKISSSTHLKRSVIIDDSDDTGLRNVASIDDDQFDFDYLGDEAPQIVEIIDERLSRTKLFGTDSHFLPDLSSDLQNKVQKGKESSTIKHRDDDRKSNSKKVNAKVHSDCDFSPRRRDSMKNRKNEDASSERHKDRSKSRKQKSSDSDFSPERKDSMRNRKNEDVTSERHKDRSKSRKQKSSDSDFSPERKDSMRKRKNEDASSERHKDRSKSRKQKSSDSDFSPERRDSMRNRKREDATSERYKDRHNTKTSKPRKQYSSDSDFSPERRDSKINRKNENFNSERYKNRHNIKTSRSRKQCSSDSDLSPQRRDSKIKRKNEDISSEKHEGKQQIKKGKDKRQYSSDSGTSPERLPSRRKNDVDPERHQSKVEKSCRKNYSSDHCLSPDPASGRRKKVKENNRIDGNYCHQEKNSFRNRHEPRKDHVSEKFKKKEESSKRYGNQDTDSDLSPERYKKQEVNERRWDKNEKTLEGKKAGLQNAKNLKEELRMLKETEDIMFRKMDARLTGENAAVVKRDRKTGKIRDLSEERKEAEKESEKDKELKNKYAKWGKGLKQIEEANERLSSVLYEMNKPLARYADDEDLDKLLKDREREGDPMLDYIRSRQTEAVNVEPQGRPKYQGHFPPNRFGIPPGHRWDGVDRSSGYEKEWFQRQSSNKAVQEEAYKWSTSDM